MNKYEFGWIVYTALAIYLSALGRRSHAVFACILATLCFLFTPIT